jgi:N utilization substance protein A
LPQAEQVPSEPYRNGERLKGYITEVRKGSKGPQIVVSRTHPGLLKKLFELEVPEIAEGIVEIKAVAREPGHRSKIAVSSNEPAVDPVGACVGPKGSRVRNVVTELRGEKIDVVPWSADPATFVANALQPAKVREARVDPETQTALVIVPDYQLSLAIGREGQNARLAARLTGWRIDIKSETQFADEQRGGPRPAQPAQPAAAAEPSPSSTQLVSEGSGAAQAGDATDGGDGSGADSAAAAGGDSAATEAELGATTRDDSAPAPADTEPSATEGAGEPVLVEDAVEGSAEEAAEEKAEA